MCKTLYSTQCTVWTFTKWFDLLSNIKYFFLQISKNNIWNNERSINNVYVLSVLIDYENFTSKDVVEVL